MPIRLSILLFYEKITLRPINISGLEIEPSVSANNLGVYKKFVWVLSGFIEILLRNIFKNLKTLKKIKSWSGGYTTSLQN